MLGIFFLALVAGTLDTLAGGGGLITVPGQIFLGVPPIVALANNKCSAFAGTTTASWRLYRRGLLKISSVWPSVLAAFAGSLLGALFLKGLQADFVAALVPWILIAIAGYFATSSYFDWPRRHLGPVAIVLAMGLIGAYDGFFGPGTGSLMLAALMLCTTWSVTQSTVHVKACNAASNIAALLVFAPSEWVIWPLAIAMLVGQSMGGVLGAYFVEYHAERWARPLVALVSVTLAGRLLYESLA